MGILKKIGKHIKKTNKNIDESSTSKSVAEAAKSNPAGQVATADVGIVDQKK